MSGYNNGYEPNQWQEDDYQRTYSSIYQGEQGDMPRRRTKKKRTFSGKMVALMMCACLVLSLGAGFGGALLAGEITGSENQKVVQFNSVDNTNTSNSENDALTKVNNAMTTAGIAAAAEDTVVEITTEAVQTSQWMQQYISQGAGSGVILSADGYIATNNHVIEDAQKITVTLRDGTTYSATLIGRDEESDLAVIKIDAQDLPVATLGNSDNLVVGEIAVAIGNPLGQLGGTVTEGIISALNREITIDGVMMSLLQTSAAINPGNSGGGLFNGNAELIGIVNAKSSGSDIEGLGFAIPINTAKGVLTELIQNGYVTGRADTGLSFVEVADYYTAMMYRVQNTGLYISKVTSGSSAQTAGFQPGDLVQTVNGTAVTTEEGFKTAIKDFEAGESVTVEILRNNMTQTLSLTLDQYIPSNGSVTA